MLITCIRVEGGGRGGRRGGGWREEGVGEKVREGWGFTFLHTRHNCRKMCRTSRSLHTISSKEGKVICMIHVYQMMVNV